MRIGIVHPLMDQAGGAELVAAEQAVHLANAGHEVSIFTDAFDAALFPMIEQSSVDVLTPVASMSPLRLPAYGIYLAQRRMLDCGRNLRQLLAKFKPDLTISHNFPAEIICSRLNGWRRFHFCHEPPYQLYGRVTQPKFHGDFDIPTQVSLGFWRIIDRRAVRSVGRLFANSKYTTSLVKECYGRESTVLYPGIDASIFRPVSSRRQRVELGLDKSRVILTCTRQHKIKGTEDFLLVLRRLRRTQPDLIGIVIGSGPEEADLWRLAHELQLSDRVLFLRSIPRHRNELASYYSLADVIVYPSHFEPLGLVPLEAMSCERPVVAYGSGGPAETIQNDVTGLLAQPGNVSDLSDCVARILADPDLGRQMGENGRRSVQSDFSWKTHVATIESEAVA